MLLTQNIFRPSGILLSNGLAPSSIGVNRTAGAGTLTMKTCTKCGAKKDESEFHCTNIRGKAGRHSWCRVCMRIKQQEWVANNKEKYQECQRAYFRQRYWENREMLRARKAGYLKAGKRRRQLSAGCEPARSRDRREWLNAGDVTSAQLHEKYAQCGGVCSYCGKDVKKGKLWKTQLSGFDHIIPRSAGGTHTINNLTVCCRYCNSRKGQRSATEFLEDVKSGGYELVDAVKAE